MQPTTEQKKKRNTLKNKEKNYIVIDKLFKNTSKLYKKNTKKIFSNFKIICGFLFCKTPKNFNDFNCRRSPLLSNNNFNIDFGKITYINWITYCRPPEKIVASPFKQFWELLQILFYLFCQKTKPYPLFI